MEAEVGDLVSWKGEPSIWGNPDRVLKGRVLQVLQAIKPGELGCLVVKSSGGFVGVLGAADLCAVVKHD